jgi:hypothetical protein
MPIGHSSNAAVIQLLWSVAEDEEGDWFAYQDPLWGASLAGQLLAGILACLTPQAAIIRILFSNGWILEQECIAA